MNKFFIAATFIACATAWAQPALTPPRLGFVEDSASALRPAYGVAGNFVLGPSVAGQVVAEAFSGSFGFLKTGTSLIAFDPQGKQLASITVASGAALFAFSPDGTTGLAYIESSNSLTEWRGTQFAPVSFNYEPGSGDRVIAIAYPSAFEASLIVERNIERDTSGIWEINIPLGSSGALSESALPGVHAPVLALPSGDLVYPDASGIVIRSSGAADVHVAATLPASYALQQMNQDWVQLLDLNGPARFAIRTTPGRESFYQLPASAGAQQSGVEQ